MFNSVNLVVIPFHSWSKVQREGCRTRDAHLISHLGRHERVKKLLIINRPTCPAEMLYKRTASGTKGEVILKYRWLQVVKVAPKMYVLDLAISDLLKPLWQQKRWFFEAYGRTELLSSIQCALRRLGMREYEVISMNAYAGRLVEKLASSHVLFDAWDNFLQFPTNKSIAGKLEESYLTYASHADRWTTNSEINARFFSDAFDVGECHVIRNGVDPEPFRRLYKTPEDMGNIPRPIAGIGAKITHLLDADLLNGVVKDNPNISFVLVGQILNRDVMKRLVGAPNFYYLGDKHYDEYPAYVQAFDVAMIPYVVGDRAHGGDAIKQYEYLAAGKPIVSTPISGLLGIPGRVFSAETREQFSAAIHDALGAKERPIDIPDDYLWSIKADHLLTELLDRPKKTLRHRAPSPPTIAFCGTRGVPANYGGFETAVDQISRRFVEQGYPCEVFCRRSSASEQVARHEGRKLTYVDGHSSRRLDTFVAAVQTGLKLWKNRRRYRHVFWFNNANLPGILITALARIPMSVNTDGLEWRRAKWSWPFKAYYWLSSFLIGRVCGRLISDSRGIQDYYRRHFYKETQFIPYGAPPEYYVSDERAKAILARYGLETGRYFLQITRIEPDNLPLQVAEAFTRSRLAARGYQMVFVGYREGTPYAQRLIAYNGRKGVRVHEAVYDHEVLQVLRNNCFCYVHGNSVGGTNPALLEAMASAPRVIAIDCNFSREVLGECGRFFHPDDLVLTLNLTERMPDESSSMRRRVRDLYDWDAVAQSYINLAGNRPADYRPVRTTADQAEPEVEPELVR